MRRLPIVAGAALLAGCYAYTPLATPSPAPGMRLALVLNDQGRYEAARQVGPSVMRVEGALVQSTDTAYVLQVSDVVDISGIRSRWSGETVPVRRMFVASTYERRFSRGRTAFALVGLTSAFIAIVVGRNLLGFGGGGDSAPPVPPPTNQ
jgi:hypothetical protein